MRLVEGLTRAREPLHWVRYETEFVLSDCRQAIDISTGEITQVAVVDSWLSSLSDVFLGAMLLYLTVAPTCTRRLGITTGYLVPRARNILLARRWHQALSKKTTVLTTLPFQHWRYSHPVRNRSSSSVGCEPANAIP